MIDLLYIVLQIDCMMKFANIHPMEDDYIEVGAPTLVETKRSLNKYGSICSESLVLLISNFRLRPRIVQTPSRGWRRAFHWRLFCRGFIPQGFSERVQLENYEKEFPLYYLLTVENFLWDYIIIKVRTAVNSFQFTKNWFHSWTKKSFYFILHDTSLESIPLFLPNSIAVLNDNSKHPF